MTIFQPAPGDALLQTFQGLFHAAGKTVSDGLLFFLTPRRAAQNVSLLALRNGDRLDLHFGPYLRPVFFRQLRFEPLHLAAWRAHQILPTPLTDRRPILLAHHAAIHDPDPSRLAIFALDHA